LTFSEGPKNRREVIFCLSLENWVIIMKLVSRSHQDYLAFVSEQLRKEYDTPEAQLFLQHFYSDLLFWITAIDLSTTASLMRSAYSANPRGRKLHDPADMIAACSL